MTEKHFDLEVEGFGRADNMLDNVHGDARRELWNILKSSASFSEVQMKFYAPGSVRSLTGHDDPVWRDAVTLEAEAGVRPGMTIGGRDPMYPLYVHEGTGLYRRSDAGLFGPRDVIRPNRPGGVLRFEKRGEGPKYRKWVRGQKPQPFVYYAYQMTKLYVRARISSFRIGRA